MQNRAFSKGNCEVHKQSRTSLVEARTALTATEGHIIQSRNISKNRFDTLICGTDIGVLQYVAQGMGRVR